MENSLYVTILVYYMQNFTNDIRLSVRHVRMSWQLIIASYCNFHIIKSQDVEFILAVYYRISFLDVHFDLRWPLVSLECHSYITFTHLVSIYLKSSYYINRLPYSRFLSR